MYFDIVELVMDIEERFGVTISDERAARICTVGDLYAFLLGQTRQGAPTPCLTSQAFYRLRRTLTGELGVDRAGVRPATRLRDLFPPESRAAAWPRLAAALGLPSLPEPDPPPGGPTARSFGFWLGVATAGALLVQLLFCLVPGERMPVAVTLLIWLLALILVCEVFGILWIERRWLRPVPVPTVRDVVLRLTARDDSRRDTALWADLTAILSRHTGVPADRIWPEHRWDDLARLGS
jgi:hypothetical protein